MLKLNIFYCILIGSCLTYLEANSIYFYRQYYSTDICSSRNWLYTTGIESDSCVTDFTFLSSLLNQRSVSATDYCQDCVAFSIVADTNTTGDCFFVF